MHSAKSLRDEADELREALRAARRQLDAGERRERALRRALKQNDLLPGEASPERRQQQRPTQPPIGQGGMLDQVLLQSGLLHTEEGRLQIAQLLAKATGVNVEAPGSQAPLPPPPAMMMQSSSSSSQRRPGQMPAGFGGSEGLHVPGFEPSPIDVSNGHPLPPAASASCLHSAAQAAPPAPLAPPPPPPPRPVGPVSDADVAATADALIELMVAEEARSVVKLSVRSAVQALLPAKKSKNKIDTGPYGLLYSALLTDVLLSEASGVVGEAIEIVAADYVLVRGADRVFQSLVEDILRDELTPLAADARVEVVFESMLNDAMGPIVREVSVAALSEARGAAARRREAEERALVAQVAANGLFERLCLQRFLQHIATSGEVLLLQVQAAEFLDLLIGEGLARRALSVGQEHAQLQASAVLGVAHERLAYKALVDEFLAQLRVLSSSGLEAGIPPPALETDTGSDSDEEGTAQLS